MTDYAQELVTRSSASYMTRAAARSKELLGQYGAWIDAYRGGVPRGWAAAIMYWESNGIASTPGDPSLGEYGLYQVAAYVPGTLGMAADTRYNPQTNVFLGLMEYQLEVAKWAAMFPGLVVLGSDDSWKLARLSFSVGWGGATGLAKLAQSSAWRGALYDAIVALVDRTGGTPLGSQSAAQVWFRVKSIAAQWEIGKMVGGLLDMPGVPTIVTPPPGTTYTIPTAYARYFSRPIPWIWLGAIAAGAYALWRTL